MKVFLHTHTPGGGLNTPDYFDQVDLDQVPAVGEHVCRPSDGKWARVQVVVHLPKSAEAAPDAEVFAIVVDHGEVMRRARGDE